MDNSVSICEEGEVEWKERRKRRGRETDRGREEDGGAGGPWIR